MERQLTLRMSVALAVQLDRAARAMRRKRSEVVRLALERYLDTPEALAPPRPIEVTRDLLGSLRSGIPDLGQRHREYLLRQLRRVR